jgi:predicted DNA-binding mobile mystery protein A
MRMAASGPQQELQRRQLDRMFETIPRDLLLHRPARGWIRELREALGISAAELARRLGVSRATVTQMERDERAGAITLKRLERAAEALECSLGYVLIPKRPLGDIVRARAHEVASRLIGQVDQSMTLEAQATSAEERTRVIDDLAADLVRRGRSLWRDQK